MSDERMVTLSLLKDRYQPTNAKIMQALEQANAQQDMNRSLLRITYILQQRKRMVFYEGWCTKVFP